MFSKRHYDAIAYALSSTKLTLVSRCDLAVEMINIFERDNPKFDRVKFLDACGLAIDKPEIVEVQL